MRLRYLRTLLGFQLLISSSIAYQRPIQPPSGKAELLWPDGAPGAVGEDDSLDRPKIYINLPDQPVGTGIIVFPGGGYSHLATDHEGRQVAQWLNQQGVAAFIVTYRLGPRYHHPAMLQDAARAVRTVRSRAEEFGIRPDRIGVLGFSAGGHLAATISTHFDAGNPEAADPVERVSSRPDFTVLCYPVITMLHYTHAGSRTSLLGEKPDPKLIWLLSNELQVTPETPPTFLFHTSNDPAVAVQNSVNYFVALRRAGVPAELHAYDALEPRHGIGLGGSDRVLSTWPERLKDWLRLRGYLPGAK